MDCYTHPRQRAIACSPKLGGKGADIHLKGGQQLQIKNILSDRLFYPPYVKSDRLFPHAWG